MLPDEKKKRIESLSTNEMLHEINLANKSRLHGEAFDYLKTCYDLRAQAKEEKRLSRQESREEESLSISRRALDISEEANKISRSAHLSRKPGRAGLPASVFSSPAFSRQRVQVSKLAPPLVAALRRLGKKMREFGGGDSLYFFRYK
jgi:hypothetical protein